MLFRSEISYILLGIDLNTKHIYNLIEIGKNSTKSTITIFFLIYLLYCMKGTTLGKNSNHTYVYGYMRAYMAKYESYFAKVPSLVP